VVATSSRATCIHTERSKTRVPGVVPLWDVTIDAMKASPALRAEPKNPAHAGRSLLAKPGRPLVVSELADGRRKVSATDSIRNKLYALINGDPQAAGTAQPPSDLASVQ
jgi:hypothetical protein